MWDIREIKVSTQAQCEIGKIYDNTAISSVSCSCPAGYQFETVEIGWGPCPVAGMQDCIATKLKCVAKTEAPGTIGITSHGVTAITTEKVTVEDNRLIVGATESAKPVNVLPDEAKSTAITSAGLTSVATTELKTEEQKPVYTVQGARSAKLLFFIPVSIKTTTKIDATSGKVISIQQPWWSFLTR